MVHEYIIENVNRRLSAVVDPEHNYTDAELLALIDRCIEKISVRADLKENEKAVVRMSVFNMRRRLGMLQPLLEDVHINEIMVNGTEGIFVERDGKIEKLPVRYTGVDELVSLIQSMASFSNRVVNESSPIVDARLADGSRINAVLKPVAINGPILTIRKFAEKSFKMEDFIVYGTLSEEEAVFLKNAVRCGMNIFISGGTSSGKTTFLNVLSGFIPDSERIITIEDSAELKLKKTNLVRMETRPQNSEGRGEINMRKLIKTALRMRPDRIIVGEVRDECALDMIQALCTGHDGSMSTAHANSASDVLLRLETMALWEGHINAEAIRRQIASGIDVIVHLERDRNMKRRVKEIVQVYSYSSGNVELNTLFLNGAAVNDYREKGGKMICVS